jgi:hypothetical protein
LLSLEKQRNTLESRAIISCKFVAAQGKAHLDRSSRPASKTCRSGRRSRSGGYPGGTATRAERRTENDPSTGVVAKSPMVTPIASPPGFSRSRASIA